MQLEQALARIKAEVVSSRSTEDVTTLMVRIHPDNMSHWVDAVKEILLHEDSLSDKTWHIDISRSYFVDRRTKAVRYLWRLMFTGDAEEAATTFGMAIIRVLSANVEVTSQPLVGRVTAPPGSTKGAHTVGAAASIIGSAFAAKGT